MPAAGLTFAVAECPVQEHANPPHLFGIRAGVDQQINSRRLTGRRFSQTPILPHRWRADRIEQYDTAWRLLWVLVVWKRRRAAAP